jgi:hypothetical protein
MEPAVDPGMETPVAPLPEVEAPAAPPAEARAAAPPRAWRVGLGRALASWRVLLFVVFVQILLGLTVVLPFFHVLSERLDHNPHAAALAGRPAPQDRDAFAWGAGMDAGLWRDLRREEHDVFAGLPLTTFWVALVAWLFGALVSGGLLATSVSGENPVRVGSFLAQGARVYGPMLRVGLCFALAWYVLARLVLEAWAGSVHPTEALAASQGVGWWGARLRELVVVVGFLWLRVAADLARARLVAQGRRGALRAFLGGLGRALRWRAAGTALLLGVPAFLVLLGLGLGTQALVGDDALVLVALFVVLQVAVLVRWAGRAAWLGACVQLDGSPTAGSRLAGRRARRRRAATGSGPAPRHR